MGVGVGVGSEGLGVGVGVGATLKLTESLSESSWSHADTVTLPFPFTVALTLIETDRYDERETLGLPALTPPLPDALTLMSAQLLLFDALQLTVRVEPFGTVPPPLHETDTSSSGLTWPKTGSAPPSSANRSSTGSTPRRTAKADLAVPRSVRRPSARMRFTSSSEKITAVQL